MSRNGFLMSFQVRHVNVANPFPHPIRQPGIRHTANGLFNHHLIVVTQHTTEYLGQDRVLLYELQLRFKRIEVVERFGRIGVEVVFLSEVLGLLHEQTRAEVPRADHLLIQRLSLTDVQDLPKEIGTLFFEAIDVGIFRTCVRSLCAVMYLNFIGRLG